MVSITILGHFAAPTAASGDLGGLLARQRQRHPGGGAQGPRARAVGRHGRLGAPAAKTEELNGEMVGMGGDPGKFMGIRCCFLWFV